MVMSLFCTDVGCLTEEQLEGIVLTCRETGDLAPLVRIVGRVFSCADALALSFCHNATPSKEELKARQARDEDKDEDEKEGDGGMNTLLCAKCSTKGVP